MADPRKIRQMIKPLPASKKNVLFVAEAPVRSSPSKVLAQALTKRGYRCVFSEDADLKSSREWNVLASEADAVIVVAYNGPKTLRVRQLALPAMRGKPIIRWWVGSDVFNVLNDPDARRGALLLNHFVRSNIAVASHLVDELGGVGIRAEYIPSIVEKLHDLEIDEGRPPQSLLLYLPTNRLHFYGYDVVKRVVAANSDIKFIVVADESHCLKVYPNVESVGWVKMDDTWQKVGGLLRITKHDGLPRMVIEALSRGKYVIYSWPLPGCWQAKTFQEVQERLDVFRRLDGPNVEGLNAVRQLLRRRPEEEFDELIEQSIVRRDYCKQIRAALTAMRLTIRMRIRWRFVQHRDAA
jgi:hypothetical protein